MFQACVVACPQLWKECESTACALLIWYPGIPFSFEFSGGGVGGGRRGGDDEPGSTTISKSEEHNHQDQKPKYHHYHYYHHKHIKPSSQPKPPPFLLLTFRCTVSLETCFLFFWAISRPNVTQIQQPWSFINCKDYGLLKTVTRVFKMEKKLTELCQENFGRFFWA